MKIITDRFSRLSIGKKKFFKSVFYFLTVVFPGPTLFLLYLGNKAFRNDIIQEYSRGLSMLALYFSCFIYYTIFKKIKLKYTVFIVPLFTLINISIIAAYGSFRSMISLYYLLDNINEAVATVNYSGVTLIVIFFAFVFLLLLGLHLFLKKKMDAFRADFSSKPGSYLYGTLAGMALFLFFLPPVPFHYFISSSVKLLGLYGQMSAAHYDEESLSGLRTQKGYSYPFSEYPFYRVLGNPLPHKSVRQGNRKNVFLITMESFNGTYFLKRDERGKEYTPVLNRIAREGWMVPDFYGTSVHTPRGHNSIDCGIYPAMLSKESIGYIDTKYKCLPSMLEEHGYNSYLFYDFMNRNFDNMEAFSQKVGFRHQYWGVQDPEDFQKDGRRKGWAILGDAEFYRRIFKKLKDIPSDAPMIVEIVNAEHHWPFDSVSGSDVTYFSLSEKQRRENFLSSLFLADASLSVFFEEFKKSRFAGNSIVVIVGDHSFPAGEHGNYYNNVNAYEENFKTVFTIYGAGSKVIESPVSQVDVAPTLLDLLNIEAPNNYQGVALTEEISEERPIFMIQPYNGMIQVIRLGKYKYMYYFSSEKELIYDLSEDPNENHPLSLQKESEKLLLNRFRGYRKFFILNQKAYSEKAFFPDSEISHP